jgi:hypothetical protein
MPTGDYTTYASVKVQGGIAVTDTSHDTLLGSLVTQVSRAIDRYTGRHFYATTETRYYAEDAIDGDKLYLDEDLLAITTLTNGNSAASTIGASYYWLIPRNVTPYHAIRLKSTANWIVDQDCYVTVVGSWGYASTAPDDVAQACIVWVLTVYNSDGATAGKTSETIGDYSVDFAMPSDARWMIPPPSVAILLEPFRKMI